MNNIPYKNFTVYFDHGQGVVVVANFKWLWQEYIKNNHQDYWLKKFSPPTNEIFQNEKL